MCEWGEWNEKTRRGMESKEQGSVGGQGWIYK